METRSSPQVHGSGPEAEARAGDAEHRRRTSSRAGRRARRDIGAANSTVYRTEADLGRLPGTREDKPGIRLNRRMEGNKTNTTSNGQRMEAAARRNADAPTRSRAGWGFETSAVTLAATATQSRDGRKKGRRRRIVMLKEKEERKYLLSSRLELKAGGGGTGGAGEVSPAALPLWFQLCRWRGQIGRAHV